MAKYRVEKTIVVLVATVMSVSYTRIQYY